MQLHATEWLRNMSEVLLLEGDGFGTAAHGWCVTVAAAPVTFQAGGDRMRGGERLRGFKGCITFGSAHYLWGWGGGEHEETQDEQWDFKAAGSGPDAGGVGCGREWELKKERVAKGFPFQTSAVRQPGRPKRRWGQAPYLGRPGWGRQGLVQWGATG